MNAELNIISKGVPKGISLTKHILDLRNINNKIDFLQPDEKYYIDEFKLDNMNKAVDIFIDALNNNKKVGVYYDVDTDGFTAGTILVEYFNNYNIIPEIFFNIGRVHGIKYNLDDIIDRVECLFIVDCGTSDHDQLNYLNGNGIDVVILDHHLESQNTKVVNVNSQYNYDNPALSGSGVAWKFCKAIDKTLNNNFADELIDLASVGIIADVCSVGEDSMENRYIVNKGLNNLTSIALSNIIGSYSFDSKSISFSIAPLLNAAARSNNNALAIDYLLCKDIKESKLLLGALQKIKEAQSDLIKQESSSIERGLNLEDKVLIGYTNIDGISGVIASKIADKYQKPTIIFCSTMKDKFTGSARTYGLECFKTLINESGYALAEGHEDACGIKIQMSDIANLKRYFKDKLKDTEFIIKEDIDVELEIKDIDNKLIQELNILNRVSGNKYKPIKILFRDIPILDYSLLKDKHIKILSKNVSIIKWNTIDLLGYDPKSDNNEIIYLLDVIGTPSFDNRKNKQIIADNFEVKESFNWL